MRTSATTVTPMMSVRKPPELLPVYCCEFHRHQHCFRLKRLGFWFQTFDELINDQNGAPSNAFEALEIAREFENQKI